MHNPARRRYWPSQSAASPAPASRTPAAGARFGRTNSASANSSPAANAAPNPLRGPAGVRPTSNRNAARNNVNAAGSANPRAAHLTYCTRLEPNRFADRDGDEDYGQGDRPAQRKEAPEHGEDQERQQQNEREIAEIALAEDHVLGGAQVAHAPACNRTPARSPAARRRRRRREIAAASRGAKPS